MLFDLSKARRVEDMPDDSEDKRAAQENCTVFTQMVDELRTICPDEGVRELMALFWDLVGKQITPTMQLESAKSVMFYAEIRDGKATAAIFVPNDFFIKCRKDPIFYGGSLVYTASKAKDYYTLKLIEDPDGIEKRARTYEAQYLRCVQSSIASWEPNEYQKKIMEENPSPDADATPLI